MATKEKGGGSKKYGRNRRKSSYAGPKHHHNRTTKGISKIKATEKVHPKLRFRMDSENPSITHRGVETERSHLAHEVYEIFNGQYRHHVPELTQRLTRSALRTMSRRPRPSAS